MKLQLYTIYFILFGFIEAQMFFKHHYEDILERVGLEYLNTSLANVSFGMHFFNRTTKSLHGHLLFFTDLAESYITIREYQMHNNEYKLTAIQFEWKLRQFLQSDLAGSREFCSSFTPPFLWPLQKMVKYKLDNWIPNNQKIPFPYAPTGNWKTVFSVYMDKKITKIFDLVAYTAVKDVPDI